MSPLISGIAASCALLVLTSVAPEGKSVVRTLNDVERASMHNVTWRPGCPVPLEALRHVEVPYNAPDKKTRRGGLVVHEDVAHDIAAIFDELYRLGFIIEDIAPALTKHGKDDALMRSNVTSAFNCRKVTGGRSYSRHSFGRAVDINPLWNPYIKGKTVLPKEAPAFAKPPRETDRPGIIHAASPVVALFKKYGWTWGGNWRRVKDFQHFEKR